MIEISDQLKPHIPSRDRFEHMLSLRGEIFREVKNRKTMKVTIGSSPYFIKIHLGCGWGEILKNLFRFQWPVISARNEWQAAEALGRFGIRVPRIMGKGIRGSNPAALESFVLMESLEGMISLEDLLPKLPARGYGLHLKRQLIRKVAEIARCLHENGMNHRDFYLCHFLVADRDWTQWRTGDPLNLHLIDLHRVQIRNSIPIRWRVKDLGGLLFSSFDARLTSTDLIRFMKVYQPQDSGTRQLWKRVYRNARSIYERYYRRPVPYLALSK